MLYKKSNLLQKIQLVQRKMHKNIKQFIKFSLVGVSNTAVSYIVYCLFVLIDKDLYLIGNGAGFFVGVLNSYFWNSRFVFKKKDCRVSTLLKTYISYGITFLLNMFILYLLVDVAGIHEMIAPIINIIILTPINFLLNKLWAFRK